MNATPDTATMIAELSEWIDESYPNHVAPETALWRRVAKVSEEAGEVIAALIGYVGENPRKGVTHTLDDLIGELLDTALCALCAVEHLTDNTAQSVALLEAKVRTVSARAHRAGEER